MVPSAGVTRHFFPLSLFSRLFSRDTTPPLANKAANAPNSAIDTTRGGVSPMLLDGAAVADVPCPPDILGASRRLVNRDPVVSIFIGSL
ncbi:MAG: hypothetical protein ACD_62C00019G0002 [uncultured bacterium]|nr:MAG: hypothetical protein ACD_62C00019G0002 [uncultured bacterium]